MDNIKRILWVDDYKENSASSLFPPDETNIVTTMDQAIREIKGSNLYMYDTIVLDIDFENGLDNPEDIIKELRKKIYLSKDQIKKDFIISNGGYLLFLYLLESGYPSNRIAFLTGNAGILAELKKYNEQCLMEMSKDDIADEFIKAWKNAGEDFAIFDDSIDKIPVSIEYKVPKFYNECVLKLIDKDWDGVRKLVAGVVPQRLTDPLMNTGDKMIFRFHDANLEAPVYFSKKDDFAGHNLNDAEDWLKDMRTDDRVTRWLILRAGDFVESQFRLDEKSAVSQIHDVMGKISGDGGMRNAFRQMYFVFDGLRISEHKGIYYQAMSAMLVPFEAKPKNEDNNVYDADHQDIKVRRMFAWCLKQARNYCAHNKMGLTLSNGTTLFLIMIALTTVLRRDQWKQMENWYHQASGLVKEKFGKARSSDTDYRNLVDGMLVSLVENSKVDFDEASRKVYLNKDYTNYTSRDYLYAFGFNKEMDNASEANSERRERYYVYTIAAYILKWFDFAPIGNVSNWYGESVKCVYEVAEKIVENFKYDG